MKDIFVSILACFLAFGALPALLMNTRADTFYNSNIDTSAPVGSSSHGNDMAAFTASVRMAFHSLENTEYTSNILYVLNFVHAQTSEFHGKGQTFSHVCSALRYVSKVMESCSASFARHTCDAIVVKLTSICESREYASIVSKWRGPISCNWRLFQDQRR
jgi:hypothetical protein